MIYLSILLFIIFLLLKNNIILYTNINIFNKKTNLISRSTRYGILVTSIFIFIIYSLDKLFNTKYAIIVHNAYLFLMLLFCATILIIISLSYKKVLIYLFCFSVFCVVIFFFYRITNEPKIQISNRKLIITTLSTYVVELNEIDSIWISEVDFNIDKKISGADLANYYRGKFKINNRKNSDLLIINKLSKPFIYMQLKNNTQLIFNNSDKTKTLQNFNFISQSLNKTK